MTTDQLREAARESLEMLPADQLKVAAEFLRYLQERASEEATRELLSIPGLEEDLEEAEREIAEGKTTPVESLSRKQQQDV